MTPESLRALTKDELIALVLTLVGQVRALTEQAAQTAILTARVAELEAKAATPPKTPANSSLPPSKGQKANRPERPKKPRKGRPGVARALAEAPDAVLDIGPGLCSRCDAQAVPGSDIHSYDFIDLPPIKPIVTRINLRVGLCPCCGKRVTAKPPADMAPGSPFGPGITALVVDLHTKQMVSFNRLQEFLKGVCGLDISEGAIANMLNRVGKPFAAEAARIATVVRNAAVVTSDETSARVAGKTWWQWVFGSASAVCHKIADTRGAKVVTEFLAGARPEVWGSDRYSAQRGHANAHQACLAHLLRDVQFALDAGDWIFAEPCKRLLQEAVAIGRRREALTDATLKTYRRDLERRLDRLLERSPKIEQGEKLRGSIGRWKDCLFVFVTRRDVDPTNNVSERQLRPSVIFRKVTNGFRSVWGSEVYADICSVLATGALHGHTALAAIKTCLAGRSVLNST